MKSLINELSKTHNLSNKNLKILIENDFEVSDLYKAADNQRQKIYGNKVYIRGLIEFTNFCKNNCYYCGIRAENKNVLRYRLTEDEILSCCKSGYHLGFRTFVLQGGEDNHYTDKDICNIVSAIKGKFSDCAVTLSIGEKPKESYKEYFNAGADRYLLRHETADCSHYSRLHPDNMSLKSRKECLYNLKEIGYETGAGFMVGSPFQTTEHIIQDLRFLQELEPDMIGIGPFISHSETPFAKYKNGGFELTLRLISILRLMFPNVLLPATTALGTINPKGREMGLMAGANVVMPNLSPVENRKLYQIYENKLYSDEEAAESIEMLKKQVADIGYEIVTDIGNRKKIRCC